MKYKLLYLLVIYPLLTASQTGVSAEFYLSPKGDDSAEGSMENPWKTFRFATRPGRISPGDTLFLRGGTYFEKGIIRIGVSGTAEKPITIRNFENETPVIDGSREEFLTIPNKEWVLHDSDRQIYRSSRTYDNFEVKRVRGFFQSGETKYSLVPYMNYKHLSADDEHFKHEGFTYVGPGLFFDESDKHIYIRLKTTQIQKKKWILRFRK